VISTVLFTFKGHKEKDIPPEMSGQGGISKYNM